MSDLNVASLCEAIDAGNVDQLRDLPHDDLLNILGGIRWFSIHQGAKRVCDKHNAMAATAMQRADTVRYRHLVKSVIGELSDIIHDGAYGNDEIGSWRPE